MQYLDYLWGVLPGRFRHFARHQAARCIDEFLTLFPATVELSLCAIIFAVVLGIPAGIFAAVKRGSLVRPGRSMGTALVGYSMPIFWWGLLLIIFFSGILRLDAGLGPHLAACIFFPPVTGFMLIDSLLSGQKGAFTSALSAI